MSNSRPFLAWWRVDSIIKTFSASLMLKSDKMESYSQHLSFFITYEWTQQARLFVPVKPFQLSIVANIHKLSRKMRNHRWVCVWEVSDNDIPKMTIPTKYHRSLLNLKTQANKHERDCHLGVRKWGWTGQSGTIFEINRLTLF